MARQRVVQTYKPPHAWRHTPPGIGDFIRGVCHLFEHLQSRDLDLRIDVSQTGFAALIEQDDTCFHAGDPARVAAASEHFEDDDALVAELAAFRASGASALYVCSNMGAWDRLTLPSATRQFASSFYHFTESIEATVADAVPATEYAVLSVRCGDHVFGDAATALPVDVAQEVTNIIENGILPQSRLPIVVISDSLALKRQLAERYGLASLGHEPGHGARGDERAVALDLCLLRRSRHNYHINAWADWWSGFSHYTSRIFEIPSTNFRSPRFAREEITAEGRLRRPRWWRRR
jgi:hypothetical protein